MSNNQPINTAIECGASQLTTTSNEGSPMKTIIFALCMLLSACATFTVHEKQFLYPDVRVSAEQLEKEYPGYSKHALKLHGHDGQILYGEAYLNDNARITVLYWGGNQFRIGESVGNLVKTYLQHPVNFIAMDHRGYGQSEGSPTVESLQKDGLVILDQVRARFPHLPIVLHGHSLGSFTVGYVAQQREVDGLILEGSATSAKEWAHTHIPWFAKLFVTVNIADNVKPLSNLASVKAQNGSVLIVVGENDDITPKTLSEKLYQAATAARYRDIAIIKGAGHNNATSKPQFHDALSTFIRSLPSKTTAEVRP